jgi:hypothetical protein
MDRRDSDERSSSSCVGEAYEVNDSMHEEGTTAGSRPSWSLQSILPPQKPGRPGTGSHHIPMAARQDKACPRHPRRKTDRAWSSAVSTTSVIGDVGDVESALKWVCAVG